MNTKLDERVAIAQGWAKSEAVEFNRNRKIITWHDKLDNYIESYHPTADTVEGRSQCWELADKHDIDGYVIDDFDTYAVVVMGSGYINLVPLYALTANGLMSVG